MLCPGGHNLFMNNSVEALTKLAEVAAQQVEFVLSQEYDFGTSWGEPVIDELATSTNLVRLLKPSAFYTEAIESLKVDPHLHEFLPIDGELDQMIMTPYGGSRMGIEGILMGILEASFRLLLLYGKSITADNFVRTVLEQYETVVRAAQGDKPTVHYVFGLAGFSLNQSASISMPWGTIHPFQSRRFVNTLHFRRSSVTSTAVLVAPRPIHVSFSRDASPEVSVDLDEFPNETRMRSLAPLAFALGTSAQNRCAPLITFETVIDPFSPGWSCSTPNHARPYLSAVTIVGKAIEPIESMARILEEKNQANLQIAANKLVSAISQRNDSVDSLIDAVTAWENLVGTKNETTFRVTASLANLLHSTLVAREKCRRELSHIYDLRSKIIHGSSFKHEEIERAKQTAIDTGVAALKALYTHRGELLALTSTDRSNRLLMSPDGGT